MKRNNKLTAYWSKKEEDIEVYKPLSRYNGIYGYLFNNVFNHDFRKEMEERGYDITTMKFEICPKLPNEEKFPTLTEIYKENPEDL